MFYKSIEDCTLFTKPIIKESYSESFLRVSEQEVINNLSFENIFNNKFQNTQKVYIKCGYSKEKKIIKNRANSYYKIISEILNPDFIFIVFEFINETSNICKSENDVEMMEFKKRISYNNEIIGMLKNNIIINNSNYKLVGIITTPTPDHYTGIILNIKIGNTKLINNKDYYYDCLNGYIETIDNANN